MHHNELDELEDREEARLREANGGSCPGPGRVHGQR